MCITIFFFSSRRRHTRCALVTGVQTCALPIYGDVNTLLGKLGIAGAIKLAPAEIVAAAWEGKTVMVGGNSGLTLERRRVNGESRLELSGFDPRSLPALKAKGCFTEIIQFRTKIGRAHV